MLVAGSSWTVTGLGDHVFVDSLALANLIDAALAGVAGTDAFAGVAAGFLAHGGGNFGHISTLSAPTPPLGIDGGAAA